ncbi:MAG TPA: hypothetical protein PK261_10165, partial [Accumulibacter sp.]|nr:hypothetical protein [Accumulibacter sp.]
MSAERAVATPDSGKSPGKAVSLGRPGDHEEVAARAFAAQTTSLTCVACRDDSPCPACAGAAGSLARASD